jgi:hypothetical protein
VLAALSTIGFTCLYCSLHPAELKLATALFCIGPGSQITLGHR